MTGDAGVSEPGRAVAGSSTVSLDSAGVKMLFFSDLVGAAEAPRQVVVETSLLSMSVPADRLVMNASISAGALPGVDLTASNGSERRCRSSRPFTLPTIDLGGECGKLSASQAGSPTAVSTPWPSYQNFYSDLILYAGAFAAGGNPQADGVTMYVTKRSALPRSPTLMHMNRVWTDIVDPRPGGRTLLHEFGHRWLQFVETMENGSRYHFAQSGTGAPTAVRVPSSRLSGDDALRHVNHGWWLLYAEREHVQHRYGQSVRLQLARSLSHGPGRTRRSAADVLHRGNQPAARRLLHTPKQRNGHRHAKERHHPAGGRRHGPAHASEPAIVQCRVRTRGIGAIE